ncbi:MAG: prepilin-type N-terminal cleavage/methylation domain-containing protein [Magnetococcales bacterium]|nr:prepilin-type N-terminal cleavage/methylation domain-containing protein [Magnetococcales bacterium]
MNLPDLPNPSGRLPASRPRLRRRPAKGFTLIEVIIFMVIVSASVTAIFGFFTNVQLQMMLPIKGVQASYLGMERMESIIQDRMVNGFDNVTETNPAAIYQDEAALSGNFSEYNRTVTIQGANEVANVVTCTGAAPTTENLRCVTVEVYEAAAGQLWSKLEWVAGRYNTTP